MTDSFQVSEKCRVGCAVAARRKRVRPFCPTRKQKPRKRTPLVESRHRVRWSLAIANERVRPRLAADTRGGVLARARARGAVDDSRGRSSRERGGGGAPWGRTRARPDCQTSTAFLCCWHWASAFTPSLRAIFFWLFWGHFLIFLGAQRPTQGQGARGFFVFFFEGDGGSAGRPEPRAHVRARAVGAPREKN